MSNNVDLTRMHIDRRLLLLYHSHGSSFPGRVIVARHTVSRKISRICRQAALVAGSKITVVGENPAFFRGEV
jgi:hypothetical protein